MWLDEAPLRVTMYPTRGWGRQGKPIEVITNPIHTGQGNLTLVVTMTSEVCVLFGDM